MIQPQTHKPKAVRRASTASILKPYLDANVPIERLEVIAEPDGTVRVFVRPEQPSAPIEPKTDWNNAPAFT